MKRTVLKDLSKNLLSIPYFDKKSIKRSVFSKKILNSLLNVLYFVQRKSFNSERYRMFNRNYRVRHLAILINLIYLCLEKFVNEALCNVSIDSC